MPFSKLADKYCYLYSEESYSDMLQKHAPRKRIKGFLEMFKDKFSINGSYVSLIQATSPSTTDSAVIPSTSDSAVTPSISDSAVTPNTSDSVVTPTSDSAVIPNTSDSAVTPNTSDSAVIPNTSDSAVTPSTSDSAVTPSVTNSVVKSNTTDSTETGCPSPPEVDVVVHFQYGKKKFPNKIQCNNIEQFKKKVFESLLARAPDCKPTQVEYHCSDEWYLLEEAESFEELLIDSKTKMTIRAVPTVHLIESPTSKPILKPMSVSIGHHGEVEIVSDTPNKTGLDTPEDIKRKGELQDVINVSIDYLQRSLVILIKSVMIKLYGTKETLKELLHLTQRLKLEVRKCGSSSGPRNKVVAQYNSKISKMVEDKCCFWEEPQEADADSEVCSKDWLYHLIKFFPRKSKKIPDKEYEGMSESDLTSLPADLCLKVITRATNDGVHIFSSSCINFKSHSLHSWEFVKLSESVWNIRNVYSHPPKYEKLAARFKKDVLEIEKLSEEIVQWVETESGGNSDDIKIVKDDYQHIKQKRKVQEVETSARINKVINSVLKFDFNHYGYILFSALKAKELDISELMHLSSIPWSAVIDFDTHSKENGLYSTMCESDDTNNWIKTKYLSEKIYTNSFSFADLDLDRIERANLVKPNHVPWLFPHGDVEDESYLACPLGNHPSYSDVVQKPVYSAIRVIANSITKQKSGSPYGIVSIVLCYGCFAYNSQKLPYPQFLDDFAYLCNFLSVEFRNVVVLTDNVEVYLLLRSKPEIKVFNFPLAVFCRTVNEQLKDASEDIPPVRLPTCHGLQEIQFVEEDFQLVHEHIAEHEMRKAMFEKQTEIRQQADAFFEREMKLDEYSLRHKIMKQLKINFYNCETVSFISLNSGDAIEREEESEVIAHLKELLKERTNHKTEPAKYVLYHTVGAGATTLSRRIIWWLRTEYPCVILKPNYQSSDAKIRDTSQALKTLYKLVEMPILMLIDEESAFQTVPQLTNRVQIDGIPMVFLHVQRFKTDMHSIISTGIKTDNTDSYFLPSTLTKRDAYNFQEKLCTAFDEEKVSAGSEKINEIIASMVVPKVGDKVQDNINRAKFQCGIISKIRRQSDFYEVEVEWENGKLDKWCSIGTITEPGYRRVYITNISSRMIQLFETFHFYGIMCLGEDFRKPMKDHIKRCLQAISSCKMLRLLAHLSLLFAFKISEVLPSRSFQHLCYKVMNFTQSKNCDLSTVLPDCAKEFAVVDPLGQFRIVHSIVANEILDFFLSTSGIPLSELMCEFLQYMLCDSEYPNKGIESAVIKLLYDREMHYSKESYFTRKSFSEVILAIEERESKKAAIAVLQCALPLINNCHAYGHLARYLSKQVNDFEQALAAIDCAETLAFQNSEVAIVQNIKGDIYRDKLEHYLTDHNNPDWDNPQEHTYVYYDRACEAYQKSYNSNSLHFPLNGEIKVCLSLLSKAKKHFVKNNPGKDFTVTVFSSLHLTESVVKCTRLFKMVEDYIRCGAGGKDSDSHEASVAIHKTEYHNIIDSDPEEQKKILQDLIDSNVKSEHKVVCRRRYVQLCLPGQMPTRHKANVKASAYEYHYLLHILEENFATVGYNDTDMLLWLSVVRKLPTGNKIDEIERKLKNWYSAITRTRESSMWLNFYFSIFYFIKLISCDHAETPMIIKNFKDCNKKVQEEGKLKKSRSRIVEWLHAAGEGFQCLCSGEQLLSKMRQFEGRVNILEQNDFEKRKNVSLSWKGIHVHYDPAPSDQLNNGQHVKFTVGFSLRGIRAIRVEPSPMSPTYQATSSGLQKEAAVPHSVKIKYLCKGGRYFDTS